MAKRGDASQHSSATQGDSAPLCPARCQQQPWGESGSSRQALGPQTHSLGAGRWHALSLTFRLAHPGNTQKDPSGERLNHARDDARREAARGSPLVTHGSPPSRPTLAFSPVISGGLRQRQSHGIQAAHRQASCRKEWRTC